jgi:AcrR family transcriptional regulator
VSSVSRQSPMSLRERKKQQTRTAIADAATALFARHGFDAVTVDDVAQAAGVSRQTVFNYYSTKEEMLFDRDHAVLEALLAAIRDRGDRRSLVDVFRAHTIGFWERLRAAGAGAAPAAELWGVVRATPALRDYAEIVFARHARAIAVALAQERGVPEEDPSCQATARMLCAGNATILTCGLDRLARGEDPASVADEMLAEAERVYDLVEHGLSRSV